MYFEKQVDVTPKRKDTPEFKYSLYNSFVAVKKQAFDSHNEPRNVINEYVYIHVLNGGPGAIVCVMFKDKTISMLLSNLTVDQFNELALFLSWIEINFWNI
jgi:hypothetical protein